MNEIAVNFGPGGHLCGTLTLPTGNPRPIALLLCNAGVIHRIGPHRINVKLARALAVRGFAVLRMDLAGQGDSGRPTSARSFEEQAVHDLQAGMDHVKRLTGIQHFALAGICSGAHHGLDAALADERIVALWMLDGYAYSTPRTFRVRVARQLSVEPAQSLMRWLLWPIRRLARLFATRGIAGPATTKHPVPERERFATMIQTLVTRGVHLQVVYTRSMFWQFNHASQWQDAFADYGEVATVPCTYSPEMDHTVTSLAAQQVMIDSVSRWLEGALVPCTAPGNLAKLQPDRQQHRALLCE